MKYKVIVQEDGRYLSSVIKESVDLMVAARVRDDWNKVYATRYKHAVVVGCYEREFYQK